jgi:hypothetical protein
MSERMSLANACQRAYVPSRSSALYVAVTPRWASADVCQKDWLLGWFGFVTSRSVQPASVRPASSALNVLRSRMALLGGCMEVTVVARLLTAGGRCRS